MLDALPAPLAAALGGLWTAAVLMAISAALFGALALAVRRDEALPALRRSLPELRINLSLAFFDALLIGPVIGLLVHVIRGFIESERLYLVQPTVWAPVHDAGVFLAVVFVSDFISYWRHRLEHSRWLWPAHAIHHSDTDVGWLTLARFHPVNRVTTAAVDIALLVPFGFPAWALVADHMVRHYYGEFVHADVPWTYGPLKRLLVSPAMHRWHHARDIVGSASNFATVFSVFDRAFGTYHVPGPCRVPLGVNDPIVPSTVGQLVYPFKAWAAQLRTLRRPRQDRPVEPPLD